MVLDRASHVTLDTCQLHDTWSSAVWARGASSGHVLDSSVARCGGYGALYCTNGALIKMDKVKDVCTKFQSFSLEIGMLLHRLRGVTFSEYYPEISFAPLDKVKQSANPRGCGVFVLHCGSRVLVTNSSLDSNKWSGLGCRWSGAAEVRGCSLDSNGQGAWAIRKSTIKDVVRENNTVTNDFTDEQYKKVQQIQQI